MNWYPRFPGDYMRDTAHLSLTEHGVYAVLLDHYYATAEPLPADHTALMRLCRAYDDPERAAVKSIADKFFPVNGDGLRHNKRADRQLADMTGKHAALSKAGKKGMEKRWQQKGKKAGNNEVINHHINQAIAYPEPEPEPYPDSQNPDSLAPGKPDASKPKKRNYQFEAIAELDGELLELNKTAVGRIGKALKEIMEVAPDVTPEEIRRRAHNYRSHFDGAACTSTALAKHWAKCKTNKGIQQTLPTSPLAPTAAGAASTLSMENVPE